MFKYHFFIVFPFLITLIGCGAQKKSSYQTQNCKIVICKKEYHPYKDLQIFYPEITGFSDQLIQDTVNRKLKSLFVDEHEFSDMFWEDTAEHELDEEDESMTFESSFRSEIKNRIIILTQSSYYYGGGAHGMPIEHVYYIDAQTGQFYFLVDLLNNPQDIQIVRTMIQAQFDARKDELGDLTDTIHLRPNQDFTITQNGIEIYFHPYEIAPYCCGFPTFEITWQEMDGILNKQGAFWKHLHRFCEQIFI